jgi:serine/threonine protein kinase
MADVIKSMTWEDLDAESLGYMAPECFLKNKGYKFYGRIDVWSTGVIFYAMLTGELLFKGSTAE